MLYFIFAIEILFLLGFIFWVGSHLYSSIFHVPYVNATSSAIFDGLKFADLKKDENFIDLGSGRGDALIVASRDFGANASGFEISPLPFLLSKIKTWRRKNIKITFGDFKKSAEILKTADVVYLYLLNEVLAKIEDWLFENIGNNTRVVTLAFQFPKHQPIKISSTKNLGRQTKIFLYQKS
ncbi:MAG: hypothetical protein NTW79_03690 [Candidatus Berkelbacteria bacterium]|nr:hypothetical protein [Candidatus Berkelbacteria bacterium]